MLDLKRKRELIVAWFIYIALYFYLLYIVLKNPLNNIPRLKKKNLFFFTKTQICALNQAAIGLEAILRQDILPQPIMNLTGLLSAVCLNLPRDYLERGQIATLRLVSCIIIFQSSRKESSLLDSFKYGK